MSELVNEPGSPLFLPSLMDVETIIGYNFKNKDLVLTHHSYKDDDCQSYERLEYLGDSVLNLMITKEHYFLYLKSGDLTLLHAANVDTEALARVAYKHGFHRFLRDHDPLLDKRVQEFLEGIKEYPLHSHGLIHSPKILSDIVESIIGAIYVDTNLSNGRYMGGGEEVVTTFDNVGKPQVEPGDKVEPNVPEDGNKARVQKFVGRERGY